MEHQSPLYRTFFDFMYTFFEMQQLNKVSTLEGVALCRFGME